MVHLHFYEGHSNVKGEFHADNNHKGTDSQLRDAVLRQLEWDPQVSSKDINVATADNVVTLTGFVHSYAEKYAAEKAAQGVYGVKALANDIEVKPASARTDPEIARDAVHAMKINVTVPDEKIKTREEAELAAWAAPGVAEVIDHISIVP